MSVNLEIQVGAVHPVVGPVDGDECLAEIVQGGLSGVLELRFGQCDPNEPFVRRAADSTTLAQAERRLLGHLDLGDHPASRGIQPDEVDSDCLTDHAASSVAADEVLRSKRRVVRQHDVDAGVVLSEADHAAATDDRNPELPDPVSQEGLEAALPEPKYVVVAGGEVADVQQGPGEPLHRMHLPLGQEPFRDATLIEHFDRAGEKTPGSRSVHDPDRCVVRR